MDVYLKNGVSVLLNRKTGDVHFSISTSGIQKIYSVTSEYLLFLELIKSNHNIEVIYDEITKKYPNFDKHEFLETIDNLKKEGIITYSTNSIEGLSKSELNRYRRQVEFFSDLNPSAENSWDFQKKLKESTVFILGIGGLGSWICQLLTMMGVGRLIICDFDSVDEHNLTRQTLYDMTDIGNSKLNSIEKKLLLLNDSIKIEKIENQIKNMTDLECLSSQFKKSDVVINCSDFPDINTTSKWVSSMCMKFNKKHIIGGGYNGHTGLIGPSIIPYKSACWGCFEAQFNHDLEEINFDILANTRKSAGAIAILSSIIANIQAWECIKMITGIDTIQTMNRRGFFDIRTYAITWEETDRASQCELCRGGDGYGK